MDHSAVRGQQGPLRSAAGLAARIQQDFFFGKPVITLAYSIFVINKKLFIGNSNFKKSYL